MSETCYIPGAVNPTIPEPPKVGRLAVGDRVRFDLGKGERTGDVTAVHAEGEPTIVPCVDVMTPDGRVRLALGRGEKIKEAKR